MSFALVVSPWLHIELAVERHLGQRPFERRKEWQLGVMHTEKKDFTLVFIYLVFLG